MTKCNRRLLDSAGISQCISLVCYSDTHNGHATIDLPDADILIHAGDLSQSGTYEEIINAIEFIGSADRKYLHKIIIAGNHDISLDPDCTFQSALAKRHGKRADAAEFAQLLRRMKELGIHYLSPQTQNIIKLTIRDRQITVYGTPCMYSSAGPTAFVSSEYENLYGDIPTNIDVVITHTPPFNTLDEMVDRNGVKSHKGCKFLAQALERTGPKLAVFGHIHESRGRMIRDHSDGTFTEFVNAARFKEGVEGFLQHI